MAKREKKNCSHEHDGAHGAHGHGMSSPHKGADHAADLTRLRRIKGQVEGVERMIEEARYCPEILVQTRAIAAAVRALEASILEKHLGHCVRDAFQSKNESEAEDKIQELIELFKKQV